MWPDLRFAFRGLVKSPIFTATAVLSIALGIGANTAIFSLLDQIILRSLPVSNPESLVAFHGTYSAPATNSSSWTSNSESVFPYPFFQELRTRNRSFSGIIASASAPVRMTWLGNTEAADAQLVSGDFFKTLGVKTESGRALSPDDEARAAPVAVLSFNTWTTRYGSNPALLNQKVLINGQPFVVIGVASRTFHGLVQGDTPDLYVPITTQRMISPAATSYQDGTFSWLNIFGRLEPGLTMAQAQAQTDAFFRAILENDNRSRSVKDREEALKSRLELRPAARGVAELREKWEKPLIVLMTMVGLVLLIACANVAGLLLARATGRQREILIRLALGARRWPLVKQLLAEGLILSVAGTLAGLLVEYWATAALLGILPQSATGGWIRNALDVRVLSYSLALSVICTLLFALYPALNATRASVATALKDLTGGVISGSSSSALRRLLVSAQVALSLLLVVGAGLFSASARNLLTADRGFRTQRLLMFSVNAPLVREGAVATSAFYRDLLDRLKSLPDQTGIAAGDSGPYSNSGWGTGMRVEGYQGKDGDVTGGGIEGVTPGYFSALGIPLRAGREFDERDAAGSRPTIVINESFARKFFAGQSPLGRHITVLSQHSDKIGREIIGVTADVRTNPRRQVQPAVFVPYTQRDQAAKMVFYVRSNSDSATLAPLIRQIVQQADSGLPAPEVRPIDVAISEALYASRLVAALSTAFGILATLLAAIGLYGVIAFAVARRTNEIGVRMALGAMPFDIVRMVLIDAAKLAGGGIVVGLLAACALSRYVESQLFGIRPADVAIYTIAAGTLTLVTALAAFIPAWRASRIDPLNALRYE